MRCLTATVGVDETASLQQLESTYIYFDSVGGTVSVPAFGRGVAQIGTSSHTAPATVLSESLVGHDHAPIVPEACDTQDLEAHSRSLSAIDVM